MVHMSKAAVEEFVHDIFSTEPLGSDGDADGPTLEEIGIDLPMRHENWAAEQAGRVLLGAEEASMGIASYGYTVYRSLLEEPQIPDAVYLEPRCFLQETDLLDVLEETVKIAVTYDHPELVTPIVRGMIDTAGTDNFAGDRMKKYMQTVLDSADVKATYLYVDFMNKNTVKFSQKSKEFLTHMAHAIQALPEKGMHRSDPGMPRLDKQILLEEIGHAWIRKGMPVAEIDWLP
jgi:hypothetical protein